MQTLIYQRTQLTRVIGMDVPGRADALGLGWVYMAPNGRPGIIQKPAAAVDSSPIWR
jgi:D-alanyl-D-alanine-carboxypeptidase/D-alanyl-D-alanine-endopeptidase